MTNRGIQNLFLKELSSKSNREPDSWYRGPVTADEVEQQTFKPIQPLEATRTR